MAGKRGLDPYILYAVALVESAKVSKRIAKPWPWALNRQGRPFIPSSLAEAKDILGGALAKGIRNIDVGLMQVNIRWQGHRVRQPEDLLDPETNLRVGADVLAESIGSAPGNLILGIGRYHAGFHNDARAYRYGRRVFDLYELNFGLPLSISIPGCRWRTSGTGTANCMAGRRVPACCRRCPRCCPTAAAKSMCRCSLRYTGGSAGRR